MKHSLIEIVEFDSKVVGYENGLPIREKVEPYYRWYCRCGAIGGKSHSKESAGLSFDKHGIEESA